MGDSDSKHDKILQRVHLWVAVLGGILTMAIGFYNFRNIFFPQKAAAPLFAEAFPEREREIPKGPAPDQPLSLKSFLSFDQNGDGKVSRIEWKGPPADFLLLELDGNGVLTEQDFRGADFESMDRNGDGFIERLEWRKARSAFDRFDTDQDRRVSRQEYAARDKAAAAFIGGKN